MKKLVNHVNSYFIKNKSLVRILGILSYLIVLVTGVIIRGQFGKGTIFDIAVTIILIGAILCFYFNFYILRDYYRVHELKKDEQSFKE